MLKYAEIIDVDTGLCNVGIANDTNVYKTIGMSLLDVKRSDIDNKWYLAEKCPMKTDEQKAQEEAERINGLYMTRSDFFDATIKAFGADEDDLLTAIGSAIVPLGIDNTAQKIALNNYKNALNFYRKHPLFTMMSNIPIQLSEELTITITPEQWDKFFDETDKKNPDAYKELLPKEEAQQSKE